MEEIYETTKLSYKIYQYSSHSANYLATNIMVNKPTDQLSRWFTDSITPHQFIMLKLETPAIVETITFGKYTKPHVSDLKKFHVLGGIDDRNLSLLLSAGLKNDSSPEIFKLRHTTKEGLYLPVKYIKIVPLQSWGPAYNYTIWYVELHGRNQEELVKDALDTIDLLREEEAVRIVLKHLRRRKYKHAFEALTRESGVQLEAPLQARLWEALVERGDYQQVEKILEEAMEAGEFDWYMSWQRYNATWQQLCPCSAEVEARLAAADAAPPTARARAQEIPCADTDTRPEATEGSPAVDTAQGEGGGWTRPEPRGGHQLVVDPKTGNLYLFGGWSGTRDLDDLWRYDVTEQRWELLFPHSGEAGGPGPRSCHKMVLDPDRRKIYTLGRYLENTQRLPDNMKSDFHVFEITTCEWSLLSEDTAAVGGPRLVFDHQMCIDSDTHTIYVYGGRLLPPNSEEATSPVYSGLFAYYCDTGAWTELNMGDNAPLPRQGHSMVFHPLERRLYIFGGQRHKCHLAEVCWYDVETGQSGGVAGDPPPAPAPPFTQRATLHPETGDCFLLAGMSKVKDKRVYNTLWVLSLKNRSCYCVYRNGKASPSAPRPRFAHQLVYDPDRKVHYLFGGNPGVSVSPRLRLDDLWALTLRKRGPQAALRELRAACRLATYKELAAAAAVDPARAPAALEYLRGPVYETIDTTNEEEVARYNSLALALFSGRPRAETPLVRMDENWLRRLEETRRLAATNTVNLADHLSMILGGEEIQSEPRYYTESQYSSRLSTHPEADTWDVADASVGPTPAAWDTRGHRVALFDTLTKYLPPADTHPYADITNLVDI